MTRLAYVISTSFVVSAIAGGSSVPITPNLIWNAFGPIPKASVIGHALPLWTDEEGDGRYLWRAPTR